jgi:hypothetical protein
VICPEATSNRSSEAQLHDISQIFQQCELNSTGFDSEGSKEQAFKQQWPHGNYFIQQDEVATSINE